eukprot:jgi/Chrzof1/11850/Cz06g12100.t1
MQVVEPCQPDVAIVEDNDGVAYVEVHAQQHKTLVCDTEAAIKATDEAALYWGLWQSAVLKNEKQIVATQEQLSQRDAELQHMAATLSAAETREEGLLLQLAEAAAVQAADAELVFNLQQKLSTAEQAGQRQQQLAIQLQEGLMAAEVRGCA